MEVPIDFSDMVNVVYSDGEMASIDDTVIIVMVTMSQMRKFQNCINCYYLI